MNRFADDLDLAQLRIEHATEIAVAEIIRQSKEGQGRDECLDCGETIPAERLARIPNAQRCTTCQDRHERKQATYAA